MKSLVNTKKQAQFKKFMAKDSSFLKKVVGGEGSDRDVKVEGEKDVKL